VGTSGISSGFPLLSRSSGQVAHVLLTRSPLGLPWYCYQLDLVRLACVKHAASVRPEPGSNSPSRTAPPAASDQGGKSFLQSRQGPGGSCRSGIGRIVVRLMLNQLGHRLLRLPLGQARADDARTSFCSTSVPFSRSIAGRTRSTPEVRCMSADHPTRQIGSAGRPLPLPEPSRVPFWGGFLRYPRPEALSRSPARAFKDAWPKRVPRSARAGRSPG